MEANPQSPVEKKPAPGVRSVECGVWNEEPPAKSFLASKTVWIALFTLVLVPLLKRLGLEFTDAQQQETAEGIVKFMGFLGVVWARAKAQGPLQFGTGASAMLLALALGTTLLGGCSFATVRAGISFSNGNENVSVLTDGKSIRFHGGVNLNGSEVGADVSLPLPRKNRGGLAK